MQFSRVLLIISNDAWSIHQQLENLHFDGSPRIHDQIWHMAGAYDCMNSPYLGLDDERHEFDQKLPIIREICMGKAVRSDVKWRALLYKDCNVLARWLKEVDIKEQEEKEKKKNA